MAPTKIKDFPGRAVDAHLKATGRLPDEVPPVISIYHGDGRWRAECPLIPELNISSVTLFSLFNAMRDRMDHVVEGALTTAKIMREDFERCVDCGSIGQCTPGCPSKL